MTPFVTRCRIAAMATVVCSTLLIFSGFAQRKAEGSTPTMEKSLALYLRTLFKEKAARYIAAFPDLNGDGKSEAVVYLISDDVCGSGGCDTLVLAPTGSSWRVVTTITISNPPIVALPARSYGWHNIGVRVQGGGIRSGYETELRFNGKSYPRNPSVPTAQRLKGNPAGEVLIRSERDAKPLYDDQAGPP